MIILIRTDRHRVDSYYPDEYSETTQTDTHIPSQRGLTVAREGVEYSVLKVIQRSTYSHDVNGDPVGEVALERMMATLRPVGQYRADDDIELSIPQGDLARELGPLVTAALRGLI